MVEIRDPIHGYIRVEGIFQELLDTPEIQRLRRIRQLGFSYLVYPGANHTRFEHSLGVFHLSSYFENRVGEDAELLQIASLLHDVGHGPLSHVSEDVLRKYLRIEHENLRWLRNTKCGEVVEKSGYSLREISEVVLGRKYPGELLNGVIDIDRMDYLLRDSHYTGVAYGIFDHLRLIREMEFFGEKLMILEGGIQAAESLLISRFLMYPTVYNHHVSRIAERMFSRAIEYMFENRELNTEEFRMMDDYTITMRLLHSEGFPSEIMKMINERRLFKRALYVNLSSVSADISKMNVKRLERRIAEEVGIDPLYIIVDVPEDEEREFNVPVKTSKGVADLEELSPLVKMLKDAHKATRKIGIYAPKEIREEVEKISRDILGIERVKIQKSLEERWS
jgi:hypothetical protein